jgi:hypothetical protein
MTASWIVAAATMLVAVMVAMSAWRKWNIRWHRRRQWARASAAEAKAPLFLVRHGYTVVGNQVERSYPLLVDGQPLTVKLRADYVVTRDEQTFVAEVKSGKWAPRLNTPATRRQLLEYRMAFDVDGVLLIDGETGQVHKIEFPLSTQPVPTDRLISLELVVAILFFFLVVAVLALR